MQDFDYLPENELYFDSACQSLRPRPVLDALKTYYETHNSCGERVKYKWGIETDEKIEETRKKVLRYLKLSPKNYFTSFTLNTTYGINLILSQLDAKKAGIKKVITSDIEHNSVHLPTITFAKKWQIPREIVTRKNNGEIDLETLNAENALVVLNAVSNIDGRTLGNINKVIKQVKKQKGIIIIDAAATMAHNSDLLEKTEADGICFSAHKIYAPSLGGIICKKSLIDKIETTFIGGGMVNDVEKGSYDLSSSSPDHIHTVFEPGLGAFGEIIAFGKALDWLSARPKQDKQTLKNNSEKLFNYLKNNPKITLINAEPTPALSCFIENLDSHMVGKALADENIMARTGYLCVHYYLDHIKHYPPLLRFSLGYHNRGEDIEKLIQTLNKITQS